MLEITEQQWQALADPGNGPVRLMDPATREQYVVLKAEIYERLRGLLGDDFEPNIAYPAIDQAFAEGWNAPKMDDYDCYEKREEMS